ncbi:Flp family type IVb pilin [Hellea sp.]|nr:Flp family type IVb pilin [Hellea sp.]MDB2437783.1 Flp family type IVb pilin [Hellea sp.]
MQNLVTRFIKDESGATAIEYGLIAALISVALIAGAKAIGTGLDDKFTKVSKAISGQAVNQGTP